jgi:hypothetical protein
VSQCGKKIISPLDGRRGFKSLCAAMGMPESESTVRAMLGTYERPDGPRIPHPEKIKAARTWLLKARRHVEKHGEVD